MDNFSLNRVILDERLFVSPINVKKSSGLFSRYIMPLPQIPGLLQLLNLCFYPFFKL